MRKVDGLFEEIYKANYPKVIRICLGYVNGDENLAKDLVQEVFIKVWENLDTFRNEAAISTSIYRITVNTCLLQLRVKKRMILAERLDKIRDDIEEFDSSEENQLKQLYICILKLAEENKGIILLELEGLPQKEIANITGLSHEVVRVRLHRIKNSLTNCVKNENI